MRLSPLVAPAQEPPTPFLASVPIIDVDSHVVEPSDLWTSRLPRKFQDLAPKVVWDEVGGEHRWLVGDAMLTGVGEYAIAGWREPFPSHPETLQEANPAAYEPTARLASLDSTGVHAQVLYPNLIGFDSHAFITQLGPEAATACVQAYNDFITEFAATDPDRLLPITMIPYWDVEASIAEVSRCRDNGHRGVLFSALLGRIGSKNIGDPQWEPLLATIQDLGLPINFHVGFNVIDTDVRQQTADRITKNALRDRTDRLSFVKYTATAANSVIEAAAEVIMRGVPIRFPKLTFVAVESGFGYWPYILDHLDWFFHTSGARDEFPQWDLPSEYWMRHFMASFWFERRSLELVPSFQDNLMFETDFPHETALAEGPWGHSTTARAVVERNLAGLDPAVTKKVVWDNAARLYGVSVPHSLLSV